MLVARRGLDEGLDRVREQTASDAEHDLAPNHALHAGVPVPILNKQAHSQDEDERAGHGERLDALELAHEEARRDAREHRAEGVQRRDARGRQDALVEADHERRVQEVALQVPRHVQADGDGEAGEDGAVRQRAERHAGVLGELHLPDDEGGDADDDADHQHHDDAGRLPALGGAAGEGEGQQDEREHGAEQDHADQVDLLGELVDLATHGAVVLDEAAGRELALAGGAPLRQDDGREEREGADGQDDAPHGQTPPPAGVVHDGLGDVARDPGVDEEGQGGDEGEQDAALQGRDVGDEDLDQEHEAGVPDLVEQLAGGEGLDAVRGGRHDGADDVEDDGEQQELDAAELVGHAGVGRLDGGGEDRAHRVHGPEQRVLAVAVGGVRLVGEPDGGVEAVAVGDQEDADEEDDLERGVEGRGDGGNPLDTLGVDIGPGFEAMLVARGDMRPLLGALALILLFDIHGVVYIYTKYGGDSNNK